MICCNSLHSHPSSCYTALMGEQSGKFSAPESFEQNTPKLAEVNTSSKQISRRDFLKKTGITAATVALASAVRSGSGMIPLERELNPEGLQYIDNTIFLDFAPEKPIEGIRQTSYPLNVELERRLLGDKYKNLIQIIGEYGVSPSKEKILDEHPEFALLHGGLENFSTHGEIVTTAHRKVLAQFGYDTSLFISPLQSALNSESSDLDYADKLGNKGVTIEVRADPLIDQLKNTPQRIVSISFQLGKIHLVNIQRDLSVDYDYDKHQELLEELWKKLSPQYAFYPDTKTTEYYFLDKEGLKLDVFYKDGKPEYKVIDTSTGEPVTEGFRKMTQEVYEKFEEAQRRETLRQVHTLKVTNSERVDIKIKGAYSGEEGVQNIQELFKLVNEFEDKLFIVAAGNYSDDIRPLREMFKDKWPKNLLIIGQWNADENKPKAIKGATLGADIYVDNKDFGFEEDRKFSSISTACLSAVANILAKSNYSIEQIKEKLLEFNKSTEFETDYLDTLAFEPIDLERYIANIGHAQTETAHVFNFPAAVQFLQAA